MVAQGSVDKCLANASNAGKVTGSFAKLLATVCQRLRTALRYSIAGWVRCDVLDVIGRLDEILG
jgi:hypothetical protein